MSASETNTAKWARFPLHTLRGLLYLGLLGAVVVAVGGVMLALDLGTSPPSVDYEQNDQLPDLSGMAIVAVMIMLPLLLATTIPLLVALRRRRPGLARFALILHTALAALYLSLYLADVREKLECTEVEPTSLLVPCWLALTLWLALMPASLEAMGLDPRGPLAWARRAVSALFAAVLAADLVSVASSRQPGGEILDTIEIGMSHQEVRARLAPSCYEQSLGAKGSEIVCRPVAPPICRCAPTVMRTLVLDFDESARVRVRRSSWRVVGLDRAR